MMRRAGNDPARAPRAPTPDVIEASNMPIDAQAFGTAKKWAAAARLAPLPRCGCRVSVQWSGVFSTAQRNANEEPEGAGQTRKNRDARIVGICCFLGVRGAQTACNSRRSDYLVF
jgi:hypothetical protein